MTGDPIDAARALQLGLVNRVVPAAEVLDTALAFADRIARTRPIAVRLSRQLVREAVELDEADGWQRTNELALEVFSSGDAIEGATAFAEKRRARLEEHVAPTRPVALAARTGTRGSNCSYNGSPMERWRVEDLAGRADVSVDTIRFYQKRRLLPPPIREGRVAWYGAEHLDRLARIRELQTRRPDARADRAAAERRARRHRRAARRRGRVGRRRSTRGVPST